MLPFQEFQWLYDPGFELGSPALQADSLPAEQLVIQRTLSHTYLLIWEGLLERQEATGTPSADTDPGSSHFWSMIPTAMFQANPPTRSCPNTFPSSILHLFQVIPLREMSSSQPHTHLHCPQGLGPVASCLCPTGEMVMELCPVPWGGSRKGRGGDCTKSGDDFGLILHRPRKQMVEAPARKGRGIAGVVR